jgi:hypothetical protein
VRAVVTPAPEPEELAAIVAVLARRAVAEPVRPPVTKWRTFGRGDDPYGRLRGANRAWAARR